MKQVKISLTKIRRIAESVIGEELDQQFVEWINKLDKANIEAILANKVIAAATRKFREEGYQC